MPTYILSFSSSETTLARAGGKGANLAALARAGFSVPPGLVISTDAYRAFVEANRLRDRILELSTNLAPEDTASLDRASAGIRGLFEQAALPRDVAAEILAAYRELARQEQQPEGSALPVAVRSSATAEDLPGLAFAGQQETYLNVVGDEALLDAVKKCWSSLWTARALAYRARNAIPSGEVALAVVIQKMVASQSSGVLFTANPLSGRRDEIVIDASFGLGEAIVSGQVEPDHYVVDPQGWRITERRLGAKAIAIVPRAEGGTIQVERKAAAQQALPDAAIVELAQTAEQVAAEMASPQDIEWAVEDGRLFLLQSRPITTLYPVPTNPFPDPGLRVYFSLNSIQGVTDPFSPLGANVLQLFVLGGVMRLLQLKANPRDYCQRLGGRLYIDITDLARDPRLRNVVFGIFARGDPGALVAFRRLVAEGRIPDRRALTPRRALHIIRRMPPLFRRLLRALRSPEQAGRDAWGALDRIVEEERERMRGAKDLAARLKQIEEGTPGVFQRVITEGVPVLFPALMGMSIVEGWLQKWLGEPRGTTLRLMRGLPNNVTTQMDLELWHIAQSVRADPAAAAALREHPPAEVAEQYRQGALPPAAQQGINRFLEQYGMRASAEIDIARPRWGQDPAPVIATLRDYLELEDPSLSPDAVWARGRDDAEQLAAELVRRVRRTRFGPLRARILQAAIRRMRALGGLRELPKFKIVQVLGLYRDALLDSARGMVSRGELEHPDDIFFVPLDTLRLFARGQRIDLKSAARAGREDYERESRRRQLPRLLLSSGEAFYEGVASRGGRLELAGDAVSPGVAEGRVCVVLDPRGARLEPGDILVCPATDPGWTPLFLTASGLVMEIGGLVTHGSVVAREYGIPAVVGVEQATTRLRTGQRVRVDGNAGVVTVLED